MNFGAVLGTVLDAVLRSHSWQCLGDPAMLAIYLGLPCAKHVYY